MSRCPLWFRVLAGRYFLWREWRALSALEGIEGVPRPIARPHVDCLVMEYLPGKPLSTRSPYRVSDDAVRRIISIIEAAHERGVTHGDLHGHNILVTPQGSVAIIDWATASVFGSNRNGYRAFAFREWSSLDDRALAKVKMNYVPYEITDRDYRLLIKGSSRFYGIVKKLRDRFGGSKNEGNAAIRNWKEKYKEVKRYREEHSALSPEEARARMREDWIQKKNLKLSERQAKKHAKRAERQTSVPEMASEIIERN